jgi:hypothetical protein
MIRSVTTLQAEFTDRPGDIVAASKGRLLSTILRSNAVELSKLSSGC